MPSIEQLMLTGFAIICFIVIWFIPKQMVSRASFIFLSTQFFTWILGLVVVEFGWIEYPVREFAKANATSFLFEFFILPIIAIFFILHYPSGKRLILRLLYFVSIISAFTLTEFFIEKYTQVIEYHSWTWYLTWISMSLVIYIVMVIYKWFFKKDKIFRL